VADDPWTKDDPEPGDFDADVEAIDPKFVERHRGDRKARLRTIGQRLAGDHADALKRLADYDSNDNA
jgi:hypothetical protein